MSEEGTLPSQMNWNERFSTTPDMGRQKVPVCVNQAVNIQPSHYTNASFHSHAFCSKEGRRVCVQKSVLFQVKTTKSFNCVMKESVHKRRFVSELIRGAEHTVNCVWVLYRDWRLSAATVLMVAPASSALLWGCIWLSHTNTHCL